MIAAFEVGDKVQVELCGIWFKGQICRLRPRYNWTDETYAEVTGDKPEPFITTCKISGIDKDE